MRAALMLGVLSLTIPALAQEREVGSVENPSLQPKTLGSPSPDMLGDWVATVPVFEKMTITSDKGATWWSYSRLGKDAEVIGEQQAMSKGEVIADGRDGAVIIRDATIELRLGETGQMLIATMPGGRKVYMLKEVGRAK